DFMISAAKEFPDVWFCHATGTKAHTEKLSNYFNAFASIYEGRFLAGIAAGMKLNEMIEAGEFKAEEAKIGYIGAFTYAEVISGYTSFFLGARSVCPTATMEVTFTGSWYDETAEKEGANTLMDRGCKLISQHADSMGAPTACENRGVPDVSYNGSTLASCPNTFIVSSRIDWTPYFKEAIKAKMNGTSLPTDYTGTIATGSVKLTEVNDKAAAAGTSEAIETAKKALQAGTLHVFDTSTFTVGGETLTSYLADVDTDPAYTPDTEVIENGYFNESAKRSAPYFDLQIDGITLLDTAF
ncbi:MAG: BMP family ABC transporter substrate-binding protein, partial [Oscillospiraceae bacterium]|nr:BMP family ABC transporter substrate-binding protein [Oscillospiraceae bacterium]